MGEKGKTFRLTADPTYSAQSFTKFNNGVNRCMVEILRSEGSSWRILVLRCHLY